VPALELSSVATYWLFWLHMRVAGALTYVHVHSSVHSCVRRLLWLSVYVVLCRDQCQTHPFEWLVECCRCCSCT